MDNRCDEVLLESSILRMGGIVHVFAQTPTRRRHALALVTVRFSVCSKGEKATTQPGIEEVGKHREDKAEDITGF